MDTIGLHHQEQCVTFKLGHNLIGVNILDIREIVLYRNITPISRAPGFVAGLMNLRGQILTVLDIGELLGMERRDGQKGSHIIIFKHRPVGFIVDKIGDVIGIDPQLLREIPANIDPGINDYVLNILNMPDEMLLLIDAKKIVSESLLHLHKNRDA